MHLHLFHERSLEYRPGRDEIDSLYAVYHSNYYELRTALDAFTQSAANALDDAGIDP